MDNIGMDNLNSPMVGTIAGPIILQADGLMRRPSADELSALDVSALVDPNENNTVFDVNGQFVGRVTRRTGRTVRVKHHVSNIEYDYEVRIA